MPGAYRTSTDLITEVLANLGVLQAGQAIDPEDFQYANEKLDSIFRMLAGLEIVYVADPNNIPGVWFSPLADIIAGECSSKFGSTPDDRAALIAKGLGRPPGTGDAALTLKAIMRGRPTYQTLRTEFI